jgi:multidrug efflux pump subunit AcrB
MPFDTTIFVRDSIHAVRETLLEAMILVVLVVILFLQNWRAAIIPLCAVPVSLIGTFAAMYAFGFSLNNLSLFGLVLAIGIVVDDAIVVVENVERNIALGLSPVEATRKAMDEVSSALIAIALVLTAVFVPTAFLSGLTGQFYRQFALTVAVSTLISAFNSLTLSPALAALLLRPHHESARRFTTAWAGFSRDSTPGLKNPVAVTWRPLGKWCAIVVLRCSFMSACWRWRGLASIKFPVDLFHRRIKAT